MKKVIWINLIILSFLFGRWLGVRQATAKIEETVAAKFADELFPIKEGMVRTTAIIEWYQKHNEQLLGELLKRNLPIPMPPPLPEHLRK